MNKDNHNSTQHTRINLNQYTDVTCRNYCIQPFIPIIAGSSYRSRFINKPSDMLIYAFERDASSISESNMTPSITLTFIPSSMNEWIIAYNNNSNNRCMYSSNDNAIFICIGAVTKLTDITIPLYDHYIGIRFSDKTCYHNKNIERTIYTADMIDDIIQYVPEDNSHEAELIKRLQNHTSLESDASIDYICELVSEFIQKDKETQALPDNVSRVMDAIKSSNGSLSVAELADIFGYSVRHMHRIFKNTLGVGTKDYCRYTRMQYVLSEISANPKHSNSEYIANAGYSDQAHFQHEFKSFTGTSPKKLASLTLS